MKSSPCPGVIQESLPRIAYAGRSRCHGVTAIQTTASHTGNGLKGKSHRYSLLTLISNERIIVLLMLMVQHDKSLSLLSRIITYITQA